MRRCLWLSIADLGDGLECGGEEGSFRCLRLAVADLAHWENCRFWCLYLAVADLGYGEDGSRGSGLDLPIADL